MQYTLFFLILASFGSNAESQYGRLIFHDEFERAESQELKDEPGNEWTTSSDKTAYGEKQVDLRDGHMFITKHEKAWHATSVRHAFEFQDGTIALKLKFEDPKDSISLNFTDLKEKSVHAGHLFNVSINPSSVSMTDLKTGVHNLVIKKAKKEKRLSPEQKKELSKKRKTFSVQLELNRWHDVHATVESDKVTCTINGMTIGSFHSPGFAHPTKTLIRLLVNQAIHVDDVRIWRAK
jgi:hypothetical protein